MSQRWLARELARHDASLASFWPLFGNLIDHSGHSHHLSRSGSTSIPTFASHGARTGHLFNTNNGLSISPLGCPTSPDHDFVASSKFTLSCWVYLNSATSDSYIPLFSKLLINGGYEFLLDAFYGFGLMFQMGSNLTGGSGNQIVAAAYNYNDARTFGRWSQVAVTYNGSGFASGVQLYFDGKPLLTQVYRDTLSLSPSNVEDLKIGYSGHTSTWLDGVVSLARVYNRVLSANEISSLYRRESELSLVRRAAYKPGSRTIFNSLTLYLSGYATINSGLTLYTGGLQPQTGGMTLYEAASIKASGQTTLFEQGFDTKNNSATLYTAGYVPAGSTEAMPLFVQADDVPTSESGISLFAFSVGSHSGFQGGTDLFLYCDASGNVPEREMNLFLCSPDIGSSVRNMNMWVGGVNPTAEHAAPLFICNLQSGVQDGVSFFIQGLGQTEDAQPYAHGLNLYLARNPSAVMPLAVHGPGISENADVSFFSWGSILSSGLVPLVIPSAVGEPTAQTKLFTSGF